MSAPAWLEHAEAPDWLGRPLTGRPDGAGDGDTVADVADVGNLLSEIFDAGGDLEINGAGFVGTALSQYRQSTVDSFAQKLVEGAVAGAADYALGAVSVLGPIVKMLPGGSYLAELLTANTQPIIDKVVNHLTGGKFSVAGLMTGSIRVISAYAEDFRTGNTKAVALLKARADMDNTTSAEAALVDKLRGDGNS